MRLVIKIFAKSEPQCSQAYKIYGKVGKTRGSLHLFVLVQPQSFFPGGREGAQSFGLALDDEVSLQSQQVHGC